MRFSRYLAIFALFRTFALADPKTEGGGEEEEELEPCTIRSPHSHSFFDINPIRVPPVDPTNPNPKKDARSESWHSRGYDYGANFTINFCGPVIENLEEVDGLDSLLYGNVSAYYEKDGKRYSIGQYDAGNALTFRGRKMILTYTYGSLCGMAPNYAHPRAHDPDLRDDDDDDGSDNGDTLPPLVSRRKMSIFSLLCDRDSLAPKVSVSFVGWSEDECAYFFEVRTAAACPAVNIKEQSIGPSGVFGVIFIITFLVYLVGGIVYQRAVLNQRGWRQLPNYPFWAGLATGAKDIVVMLLSSCFRCVRRRGGVGRFAANGRPDGGVYSRSEDENRLLDQLDEEWD